MDLLEGTELADRYTIRRLLGRGGMGAVYLADDARSGGKVALKVTAAVGAGREQVAARFAREAQIGHRLGQLAGFVRARDWGTFREVYLYLALDLVPGARPLDLRGGARRARLERLERAARLVARAHAEGVVHRDLKPANLLQGADGTICLSDFGLAKLTGGGEPEEAAADPTQLDLTASGAALGTPRYMAPEQFEDARRVDERADVYSLGVMLFYALTGAFPYEARSAGEYVAQHTRVAVGQRRLPRPRDRKPRLARALDDLRAQALAVDPDARLPSVEALAEGLRAAQPRPRASTGRTGERRGAGRARPREAGPRAPLPEPLPPGLIPGEAAGEVVNERDGSRLVWVPPGRLRMGSQEADASEDERPLHRVELTRGFFLGKHPVTQAQWARFCAATGASAPPPGPPDAPAVEVAWSDAEAYCRWAGLALPTEAQWEYAARGPEGRRFPWGDEEPRADLCLWADHPEAAAGPLPVGRFPRGASPCGCLDMAGGVWEWVADWYDTYARWVTRDPVGPPAGLFKVARGGSFSAPAAHCRASARRMLLPAMRAANLGFRVSLSPGSPPAPAR